MPHYTKALAFVFKIEQFEVKMRGRNISSVGGLA